MDKKEVCELCNIETQHDSYGQYSLRLSSMSLAEDGYLFARKDENGNLVLYAMNINGDLCEYYPKYCPECGRKLRD